MNRIKQLSDYDYTTALVCLFPILSLAYGKGYNLAALLLFLFSLISINSSKACWKIQQTRLICYCYLAYFFIFTFFMFLHGEKASYIDQTSRIVMVIPILLLIIHRGVKFQYLAAAFALGAIIAGLVATYQVYIVGMERAFSRGVGLWGKGYMPIQSGNAAIVLSMISLCFFIYFCQVKKWSYITLTLLGTVLGLFASLQSGSRGGWVFLPFALFYLAIQNRKLFSARVTLVLTLFILALITVTASTDNAVSSRFEQAFQDIEKHENNDTNTSIGLRLELWKSATYSISENPILGNSLATRLEQRQQQIRDGNIDFNPNYADWHAHNEYLEALSLRGGIGLLALLSIFFIPAYILNANKSESNLQLQTINQAGMTCLIMFSGFGLSQVYFNHNSGMIFYSFIISCFIAISIKLKHNN
ncbi:O-antigen ligase family protein [Motilimonas pumila]|uniref:O-antigen ligase family protein n=1 Tax=Motilimonas pumila TaxID=2303987 RepID=A0A418YHH2_9GAMM|nr:O-antigen ligase family protein [Motilimonas pumila]RJG49541.1 O-antigen ligase family protein [Motilimonas pumila]